MVRPITKGVIEVVKENNGRWSLSFTQLPFNRASMSKKQRLIYSEIKANGFEVHMVEEYAIRRVWDPWGNEKWIPFPEGLAHAEMGNDTFQLYDEQCIVLFRKSIKRAIRKTLYNRALVKDPVRLKRWVEKEKRLLRNGMTPEPNTDMPTISEILVHELAHIICHNRNLADSRKVVSVEKELLDQYHETHEVDLLYVLQNKVNILQHGRDFKRVYRSLCKKYGIKEVKL